MKIALISDIHGNIEALRRVHADIKKHNITHIYCLGDIVDYGAKSEEAVQFIIKHNIPAIVGNHDRAVFDNKVLAWFNDEAKESTQYTKKHLTDEAKSFLKELPLTLTPHENILLVHGCPPDSFEIYITDLHKDELLQAFSTFTQQVCFVGHTHVLGVYRLTKGHVHKEPLIRQLRLKKHSRYIINVGSVGQPRDDDNRAKYIIYDTADRIVQVKRVKYDIGKVQEQILEAGLPEENAAILE